MSRILSFLFLIFTLSIWSQGNLQFNQVKLVSTQETVPAGKVWKMENYMPASQLAIDINRQPNIAVAGGTKNFIVLINGNQVFLQTTITREVGRNDGYWSQDGYAAASDFKTLNLPYWFPTGTTVAASTNILYVNVIEFNIVP